MGRKFTIPYGLYCAHGYINPHLADAERFGTGFNDADLALFKETLSQMFEFDRSAARGEMRPRACVAFKHDSKLGNARADQLFARVQISLKEELQAENKPPRNYGDYVVKVDESDLPAGVAVEYWV